MLKKQNVYQFCVGLVCLSLLACGQDKTSTNVKNNSNQVERAEASLTPDEAKEKAKLDAENKDRVAYLSLENDLSTLSQFKRLIFSNQQVSTLPTYAMAFADAPRFLYVREQIKGRSLKQIADWFQKASSSLRFQGGQISESELVSLKSNADQLVKNFAVKYPELTKLSLNLVTDLGGFRVAFNDLHQYLLTGEYRADSFKNFPDKFQRFSEAYHTFKKTQLLAIQQYDAYLNALKIKKYAFLKQRGIEAQVVIAELNDIVYQADKLLIHSIDESGHFDPASIDLKVFKQITDAYQAKLDQLDKYSESSAAIVKEFSQPKMINNFKLSAHRTMNDLVSLQKQINLASPQVLDAYKALQEGKKFYNDYLNALNKQLKPIM